MYRFIHLQPKILSKERIRDRWSSIVRTSFFPSFVPSPFIISSFLSTLVPYREHDIFLSLFKTYTLSFISITTRSESSVSRIDNEESFDLQWQKSDSTFFSFFKVICDDIDRIFRYRVISPSNRIINFQIIVKNLFFFFLIVLNTLDILSLAK